MKRITIAAMLMLSLSGCGIFKGGGDKGPKTPLIGERVPILTYEGGAEVDPGLASAPVGVPAFEVNTS